MLRQQKVITLRFKRFQTASKVYQFLRKRDFQTAMHSSNGTTEVQVSIPLPNLVWQGRRLFSRRVK